MIKTDRLNRLADILDTYVSQPTGPSFDLQHWSQNPTKRRGGFLWLRIIECGSAACAVGLACLSDTFKSEGLRYVTDNHGISPVFSGKHNWGAVEAFFGLSPKQAQRLFSEGSYTVTTGSAAATLVAARIRELTARSERGRRRNPRRTNAVVEQIKAKAFERVE